MSLVTITFGSGAPIALVPSSTPLHEYSLKDLSSSWPMSVTIPTLIVLDAPLGDAGALPLPHGPPLPPMRPQPLMTRPAVNHSAKRRFITSSDLPQFIARARDAGILGQASTFHRT